MIEPCSMLDLPDCLKISNGTAEVVVSTAVGPRVLRYGFAGGESLFAELPEAAVSTCLGDWKPWGGHRLWAAPEDMPRSYAPDNSPVEHEPSGDLSVLLRPPVEPATGIQKEMQVTLDGEGTGATLRHRLINRGRRAIEAAPWAITIMRYGGTVILPQEPYRPHEEVLLPARPLVLWHYTDLSDPRWKLGAKYIRLTPAAEAKTPQKIGVLNKRGWVAYNLGDLLFVKRFSCEEGATYPDYGSNCETYTEAAFVEIESLGPLCRLDPGEAAEHIERWSLFRGVKIGKTETEIDSALGPLVPRLAGPPPARIHP